MTCCQQFMFGSGEPKVDISWANGQEFERITQSPANSTATFALQSDGFAQANLDFSNRWITPTVGPDQYEVFATLNSGTLNTGTTGTWLNLGATQTWTVLNTSDSASSVSANLTLQIRKVVTGTVISSATFTLKATVETGA